MSATAESPAPIQAQVWEGTQIVKNKRTKQEKEVAFVDCWLSRVHKRVAREFAHREARQHLLREAPKRNPSEHIAGDEIALVPRLERASRESTPEEITCAREKLSALAPALASLNERDEQILICHIRGDSYREIAVNLGITDQAARSSIYRTRLKLQEAAIELGYELCPLPPRKSAFSKAQTEACSLEGPGQMTHPSA